MNNEFTLTFPDKTLTKLTGNKYGRSIFCSQIKESISYTEKIIFIFPDYIDNIGSSFIQGFFDEIVKNIGISGVEKLVEIKSNTIVDIKNYVMRKLMV